jgi:molybdate transport system substrate-binding protein
VRLLVASLIAASLPLAGCANDDASTITVSAASSLTDAFTEIGAAFEEKNPDTSIRFNFAGSSTLAEQINSGAPVDVFAAASITAMQRAVDADSVETPRAFATNSLAIAVPLQNPAGISDLTDLADPAVTMVVCDSPVPCGAAANELFAKNNLVIEPASLEPDVRAVLTKVTVDEADAGIVYRTDLNAVVGEVKGIQIPDEMNVANEYAIAVTADANPDARRFVEFVTGNEGQRILQSWGFGRP